MQAQTFSTVLLGTALLVLGLNGCASTAEPKVTTEANAPTVSAAPTTVPVTPLVETTQATVVPAEAAPTSTEAIAASPSLDELNKQLWEAAQAGNTDSIRSLLSQGANPSTATASGETALHAAVASGALPAVMLLVSKGAVISATTATGWTPLHHAARFGRADIANYLIQQGADPKALTTGTPAKTPVQMALDQGDLRTARILGY